MRQKVISKWDSFESLLFQSGAETVISKWVNVYFKVGQLFQRGAKVVSKWITMLFQSNSVISNGVSSIPGISGYKTHRQNLVYHYGL